MCARGPATLMIIAGATLSVVFYGPMSELSSAAPRPSPSRRGCSAMRARARWSSGSAVCSADQAPAPRPCPRPVPLDGARRPGHRSVSSPPRSRRCGVAAGGAAGGGRRLGIGVGVVGAAGASRAPRVPSPRASRLGLPRSRARPPRPGAQGGTGAGPRDQRGREHSEHRAVVTATRPISGSARVLIWGPGAPGGRRRSRPWTGPPGAGRPRHGERIGRPGGDPVAQREPSTSRTRRTAPSATGTTGTSSSVHAGGEIARPGSAPSIGSAGSTPVSPRPGRCRWRCPPRPCRRAPP